MPAIAAACFRPPRASRGFSLLELLIVIVIVGILMGLAVPALVTFSSESARAQAASEFLSGLARARSQAITSGFPVFVCPRSSTADSTPACAGTSATDWSNGFYVFRGTGTDGTTATLTEPNILWEFANDSSAIGITQLSETTGVTALASPITFSSVGRVVGGRFVLWKICRKRGRELAKGSMVVLQFNGGANLEATTDTTACPTTGY